jgi:hypothetical protein
MTVFLHWAGKRTSSAPDIKHFFCPLRVVAEERKVNEIEGYLGSPRIWSATPRLYWVVAGEQSPWMQALGGAARLLRGLVERCP